jgi:hypothetical protein
MTWRGLLANLGVALAAVVVTIAGLEIALRVLDVRTASFHAIAGFTVYDPELGWKLAPSRNTVFHGAHFVAHVSQNAEGLRDRHYPYEREPGRGRILVLGDSVVWCWGVEHPDCFTERLEAALPDTDVINAGVPGYSTAQEMLFYEHEGRSYHPDLVLLVVVPNDFTDNLDPRQPRFRLDDGRLVAPKSPARRRKNVVGEWLQAHSRLFAHVSYLVAVAGASLQSPDTDEDRSEVSRLPAASVAASRQIAVPPLEATGAMDEEAWTLTEALMDRLAAGVQRDGARLVVVLEVMGKGMRSRQLAFWGSRGVPVLDLAPILWGAEHRGVRTRLEGDPHISPAGQELVAQALGEFLEREALVTTPGTHRTP